MKLHNKQLHTLDREIWSLLWPILLLTLVQKLGSAFEGLLVSINNSNDLTIISLCGPYITFITTVSYGLGIAVNAMTARAIGSGQWNVSYRRFIKAMLLLLLACAAGLSILIALLLPSLAGSAQMHAQIYAYMRPYLFGAPILLLFSVLLAATRGVRDAKAGMWMTFLSTPLQLFFSWFFYRNYGLSALGFGTLLSRLAACVFGIFRFRRYLSTLDGSGTAPLPKGFRLDFLKLAVPVSLSKAVSPAANAMLNGLLLSMSASLVDVRGLGGRLEPFFYLPAMAMTSVAVTLTAQKLQKESIRPLCIRLCLWSILPTLALCILAQLLAIPAWQQFTPDAALQQEGVHFWRICLLAYPLIALEMAVTSILQAMGCGLPSLVITAVRMWCVQLPLTFLAAQLHWGATGAWLAFLLSNAVSAGLSVFWACLKRKKKRNAFEEVPT